MRAKMALEIDELDHRREPLSLGTAMTTSFDLTAVFEPVEDGWVQASIAEIPGVITAGPSLDEAKELLADALREYLLAVGELDGESSSSPSRTTERLAVTLAL